MDEEKIFFRKSVQNKPFEKKNVSKPISGTLGRFPINKGKQDFKEKSYWFVEVDSNMSMTAL